MNSNWLNMYIILTVVLIFLSVCCHWRNLINMMTKTTIKEPFYDNVVDYTYKYYYGKNIEDDAVENELDKLNKDGITTVTEINKYMKTTFK